ncbi:hypothetical protein [Flavobacterium sp. M31R6]|uniref:hypothetical protein n=1 Tax=Flavobacterium sp. M31R6 TaxID=2739062 RepID=UPI0015696B2E|nr:hypothetical protein [Flavobacterium sp. M31R6]QKJ63534.1 hypothetical protein HQN62_10475 [Flavobacterium sp. M31R6]
MGTNKHIVKKMFFVVAVIFLLHSCNKRENSSIKKFYKASKGDSTAYLSLVFTKNTFYGEYEIQYGLLGKDSGAVRGNRIGDTLRGDFCYRSYGGDIKRVPFVLLEKNQKLKQGTGIISTYMTIPFYVKGTLEFKESNFLFKPIEKSQSSK